MGKKLTKEQRQNIVNLYLSGKSGIWISENFQHSTATIAKVLREEGIEVQKGRDNRRYSLNEHYLDELDNGDKFYFLGYFYADGYISSTSNKAYIDSVDKEILEKFRVLFETNRPLQEIEKHNIPNAQVTWSFRTESYYIHKALWKYGCTNNKSHEAKFPFDLFKGKEEFYRDFIRGIFDGDGSFSVRYTKLGSCKAEFSISGTKDICEGIKDVLKKELGIEINVHKHKKANVWYANTSRNEHLKKIIPWLYKDEDVFMERKRDNVKSYLKGRFGWENNIKEIIKENQEKYFEWFKDRG